MSERHYDILIATDCRLPGGTAVSVAEEVAAQWSARLRTGLLHLDSHLVAGDRPFNERLREVLTNGSAELVVGEDPVTCDVLVVRQPQILTEPTQTPLPPIDAGRRVMVANHTPRDRSGRRRFYDPAAVTAELERLLGHDWVWAPIGPNVRAALEDEPATPPMLERDWVNVIDVERWAAERTGPRTDPIVLGRHGRDLWDKWPADAETLLAAYPEHPGFEVHVLGGAETAELLLGRRPRNWIVHPYGAVRPEDFLAGVDFFVYHPHPDSIEAFGRTVLEALASGAVAVLPARFRRLFGDAAVYRDPHEVSETLREIAGDPDRYAELAARGRTAARERFSHDTHVRRLEPLLDRSIPAERRRRPAPPPTPPPRPDRPAAPGPTESGALPALRRRMRRAIGTLVRALKSVYGALPETVKRRLRPLVEAAPASLTRRGERVGWSEGPRPTVLFVLPDDLRADEVEAAIERLRRMTAAFEPVVVSGSDHDALGRVIAERGPVHTVIVRTDGEPLNEPWLVDLLIAGRSS